MSFTFCATNYTIPLIAANNPTCFAELSNVLLKVALTFPGRGKQQGSGISHQPHVLETTALLRKKGTVFL